MAVLLGSLNALVFDYVGRQKAGGTHLTYTYLKQFPVLPRPVCADPDLEFIVARVLELTYTAYDLAPFARDLRYDGPPFIWDEARRALLRADLDAYYAALYGLSRKQLRYVLDPHDLTDRELEDILDDREDPPDAPRTQTFPGETFRVLKEREIREYGEYRTQRLVLAAWERLGLAPRRVDYHQGQQRQAEPRDDKVVVIDTGTAPAAEGEPERRPVEVVFRQQAPVPDKRVAERRATTATRQEVGQPTAQQTPLPGLPEPDERPKPRGSDDELRQRVLQRCVETLAVAGPLRARDLAQRLASLDSRIDRHLVNSVLFNEGAGRVRRDQVTGLYRLKS